MPDREKVISDLEEQITWIRDNDFHKFPGWGHAVLAMRDALALLKAKEPRVMTLEEVRALQNGAVVWIEDNDKVDIIPAIVNHIWNSLPNMASFTAAYAREVKADMLWYGVKWRCWTRKPGEDEREAVKWN